MNNGSIPSVTFSRSFGSVGFPFEEGMFAPCSEILMWNFWIFLRLALAEAVGAMQKLEATAMKDMRSPVVVLLFVKREV
jgi:hypothetical protein